MNNHHWGRHHGEPPCTLANTGDLYLIPPGTTHGRRSTARRLLDAEALGFDGLRAENADWYREFYARREQGRISVGDAALTKARLPALMRSWRVADNRQTQCWSTLPDPRAFEGDEVYPVMGHDNPWWCGAPCYNEIYETTVCVMNQNDRVEFYANLVEHWLDAARQNARDVFGLPGMFLAHGYLPPIKADTYTHIGTAWELCMEIPAQVLKPVWDIWDYGGDVAFLEQRVYPALRDHCFPRLPGAGRVPGLRRIPRWDRHLR